MYNVTFKKNSLQLRHHISHTVPNILERNILPGFLVIISHISYSRFSVLYNTYIYTHICVVCIHGFHGSDSGGYWRFT